MKNRSITYLLLFGICSMLFVLQSCQETDDLRSEIDSLKNRVQVLEETANQLNTSIESLQYLLMIRSSWVSHLSKMAIL